MIKLPNTLPIPAPEPATPTVAAPAPMNLAAESMSRLTIEVWIDLIAIGAEVHSTSFLASTLVELSEPRGRTKAR